MRVASPLAVLVLWEIVTVTKVVDPILLPPVHRVVQAFWDMLVSGTLLADVWASLYRLFAGYLIGSTAGILLGVLTARVQLFEDLLDPLIHALRPISPVALLPLAIFWLGIGDVQKITITAYSAFFPVVINTYFGVKGVEPVLVRAARTLGAHSEGLIMRYIVLPGALPSIFSGLRVSLGVSFIVIIAAEMVGATNGLGYLILDSGRVLNLDAMFAGIVTLSFLGLAYDNLFLRLRARVLAWHREAH